MLVCGNYNLKSDYMYFISSSKMDSSSYLFYCGLVFICLSLLYFFRESVHGLKETFKCKLREFLRPIFMKVNGDTVYTAKEGPMQFIWEYLDTYFLMPSEYVSVSDDETEDEIEGMQDDDDDDDDDDDESVIEGMQDDDEDDDESVIEGMQDDDEEFVIEGMQNEDEDEEESVIQEDADDNEVIVEGMRETDKYSETISTSDV